MPLKEAPFVPVPIFFYFFIFWIMVGQVARSLWFRGAIRPAQLASKARVPSQQCRVS
jgi:hypothetical protein